MARNSPPFLLSPFPKMLFLLGWCPSPTLYLCQGLSPPHLSCLLSPRHPTLFPPAWVFFFGSYLFDAAHLLLATALLLVLSVCDPLLSRFTKIQIVHLISFIFRCAKMYVFDLLGEICILYDEKYAYAKHHAKKYDCFVPRAKSTHQRRRRKNK